MKVLTRRSARMAIIAFACALAAGTIYAAPFSYDRHGKRNPFVPPSKAREEALKSGREAAVETGPLEEWFRENLGGVVWDPETSYALIGDEIVGVGDEVRGCRIVEIRPESIVFEYKNKKVEVHLRTE